MKGNAAAIFKVKERVLGPKKAGLIPTVIKDHESGEDVTDPRRIKKLSVNLCKSLLTTRAP